MNTTSGRWHVFLVMLHRLLHHVYTAILPHLGRGAAQVFREESLRPDSAEERSRFLVHSARADVFLGSAVQDPATAEWIAKTIEDAGVETCYSIGCLPELSRVTSLGQFRPYPLAPRLVRILPNFLRGRRRGTKKDRALLKTLTSFYERTSSDDLTFLTLMLVNS